MLKDEQGTWVKDGDQLKEKINNYYKQLFRLSDKWQNWHQTHITYPSLEDVEIDNLDLQVTNDEIKRAIFDMKPWKSPGPDGFPARFYQKSRDIVGRNVCDFVKCIWKQSNRIA
ncbi:unnamed protein product [Lathyrus oleraceus]